MPDTSSPYRSIPDMFASRVAESGTREAFTHPRPAPHGGISTEK